MAVVAVALHVRTIAVWLQYDSKQICDIIDGVTEAGIKPPDDLMGWEKWIANSPPRMSRLRGVAWLQLLPLPVVAAIFQAIGWWEFFFAGTPQPVATGFLMVMDLLISVVAAAYGASSWLEGKKLREGIRSSGKPTFGPDERL
jgi:hypothetical protein